MVSHDIALRRPRSWRVQSIIGLLPLLVWPNLGHAKTDKVGRSGRVAAAESQPVPAAGGLGSDLNAVVIDKLRGLLSGADENVFLETVRTLGEARAGNAAVPLIEVLAMGTKPILAVATLQALRKLARPGSVDVLVLYAGNRNVDVRKNAVEALSSLKDPRVVPILMARLGDEDESVRAAAADGLVARHQTAASPRLLSLLKMNAPEAAGPLGSLAPAALIPELLELRGRVGDAELATALGAVLSRNDIADPVRVDVVKTLAQIPGGEATTALAEYVGGTALAGAKTSRAAAQKALDARSKTP